ncbi:MAG: choice-of-anchor D domain-containing protein [Myxococcota bacterium]
MSHLLIFALLGCSENSLNAFPKDPELVDTDVPVDTDEPPPPVEVTEPDIVVNPLEIDFGIRPVGQATLASFSVRNIGDARLTVSDIGVVDSTAFAVAGNTSFLLEPGESTVVDVTYLPSTGQSIGRALVESDDPDEPVVEVALIGTGAVPDLVVSPDAYDFGNVEVACSESKAIWMSNVGGDVLVVDQIDFASDGSMALVQPNALPLQIGPGDSVPVEVVFEPQAVVTGSLGTLTVSSNDPDGDVFAVQTGSSFVTSVLDVAAVPPNPALDIIFAVDQSGSMDARNSDMADALDDFVAGLGAVTADWRIGVVTYDDGCLNTWFDSTTTNYASDFDAAVLAGSQSNPNNQDTERLFALAGRALVDTAPGGCNEDFRRPDGFLHLIMISDENEQSHDPNDTQAPYDTIAGAVGVYQAYVQTPGMLTVSAVANITNSCQSQSDALAQGADRYIDMAAATGGLALDICTNQWGPQMADLGSTLPTEYSVPLTGTPVPGTMSVVADGAVLIAGWTYDPVANAVNIQTLAGQLTPGSQIEVSYTEAPTCVP